MSATRSPTILTPESLKARLSASIDNLGGNNTFACFGYNVSLPNPGLENRELGGIGIPISERDARDLIDIAARSAISSGYGSQVDQKALKSVDLRVDQFSIQNPEWGSSLKQNVLRKVHEELGLSCALEQVEVELDSLVIYGQSDFCKSSQESTDARYSRGAGQMFGKLVVALPSNHEGGELILRHGHKTKEFESTQGSGFDFQWAAWYKEVSREIKPIKSGHRIIAVYNLLVDSSMTPIPSAPSLDDAPQIALQGALQDWTVAIKAGNDSLPQYLVYRFENKFANGIPSIGNLQHADRRRAIVLKEAAESTKSIMMLGVRQLYIDREDYGDFEENDRRDTIKDLTPVDVKLVWPFGSLYYDGEDDAINPLQFDEYEDEPDEESIEDLNERWRGPPRNMATLYYRQAVCVLVPKAAANDFMSRGPTY